MGIIWNDHNLKWSYFKRNFSRFWRVFNVGGFDDWVWWHWGFSDVGEILHCIYFSFCFWYWGAFNYHLTQICVDLLVPEVGSLSIIVDHCVVLMPLTEQIFTEVGQTGQKQSSEWPFRWFDLYMILNENYHKI